MHAWESIQAAADHIEEHLEEDMEIEGLAEIAALSPFYFQRLFSRLVGKPVKEYIKLRRLAKATEELKDTKKRIIDVAVECGFSGHEILTRTFKDAFGITPEEYRKKPVRLNNFTKPELILNYAMIDEGVPIVTEGIVLEINRKTVPETRYFTGITVQAPINQLPSVSAPAVDPLGTIFDDLHSQKNSFLQLSESGCEIGVAHMGKSDGYFGYFAGAETNEKTAQPGFDSWEIAPGEYICCRIEAENFEQLVMNVLYKADNYLFGVWLKNKNIITKPYSIEYYETHAPETASMEVWVREHKGSCPE